MNRRIDRVIGITAVIGVIWLALTADVWGPIVDGETVQVAEQSEGGR